MTKDEYNAQAVAKAKENHLWLNAFSCIHPTPELKQQVGEWVLGLLNDKDNLIPAAGITSESKTIRELAELTPMLYITINKS